MLPATIFSTYKDTYIHTHTHICLCGSHLLEEIKATDNGGWLGDRVRRAFHCIPF